MRERAAATQCASLKLQSAVMSHTQKELKQAAMVAESQAVACVEESQQLYKHAEQTQVSIYICVHMKCPNYILLDVSAG